MVNGGTENGGKVKDGKRREWGGKRRGREVGKIERGGNGKGSGLKRRKGKTRGEEGMDWQGRETMLNG